MKQRKHYWGLLLRIAVIITGRWRTIKEIGQELNYSKNKWHGYADEKRIRRAIETLQQAKPQFQLEIDVDRMNYAGNGVTPRQYRLKKGWADGQYTSK